MKVKQVLISLGLLPLLSFSITKTSIANGNWSNPSTWSPSGAPASSDKILIYHTVSLDQNFTASDTIFVYKILNLKSGKILTLNPGTMILVNNATYDGGLGTVGNNAGITGNFTFQKWITRCDGYSTYGMPFTVSVNDPNWYYCNQCMSSWSNLYHYDESTPGIQDSGYYSNIGTTLQRGKGFFYWFTNYNGGQNFPRQIQLNGSINFMNDFDFNITRTYSGSFSDDGYNLVANPFPGTIDWNDGAWTKTNISGVMYTWNSCSGSYAAYVSGIGVNGGSRYISSMQGFWVRATSNNPVLKAGRGVMVDNSKTLFKTSNTDSVSRVLRLSLGDDEIAIHLDSLATGGFDPTADALKMFTPTSRLYSINNFWTSQDYAINSVKDCNQVIPVKIKGSGKLIISGFNSFHDEYSISLKDLETNEYIPVTENMEYTFTDTTQVSFQRRFQVHFVKNINTEITGIKQQQLEQLEVVKKEDVIRIYNPDPEQTNVRMYDLQGRLLYSGSFVQQVSLPGPDAPVLLWIYNDKGSHMRKIF